MDKVREFRNKDLARALVITKGMEIGNIGLSDIDSCFEYHDKLVIFFETKHEGHDMDEGQKRMYEAIVRGLTKGRVMAVCVIVDNVYDENGDIILKDCPVRKYKEGYYDWREPDRPVKAREFRDYYKYQIDHKRWGGFWSDFRAKREAIKEAKKRVKQPVQSPVGIQACDKG